MNQVVNFVISFFASAAVVAFLYSLYWCAFRRSSTEREVKGWWLPGWSCYRVVVRNMDREDSLIGIKSRAFLREVLPRKPGSSVKTFLDTEIASGERILLPGGQDFPAVCFRFEREGENLRFIHTDKMGKLIKGYEIGPEVEALTIEYYFKIKMWFLFKIEAARIYQIPRYLGESGEKGDYFEILMKGQSRPEHEIEYCLRMEEFISVTV
jgi:hypothetical protein